MFTGRADVKYSKCARFYLSTHVNPAAVLNSCYFTHSKGENISKAKSQHQPRGAFKCRGAFMREGTLQIHTETKCQREHLEPDVFDPLAQNPSGYLHE